MKETQRQQQKRETRQRILDAAMQQFAQNGLTRTRTVDIAKAAGLSHGTLFAHFDTQEELVREVIENFGRRVNNRLHELAGGSSGLKEALEAHLAGLAEHEAFYTWLVMENRLLSDYVRGTYVSIQSATAFHIGQAAAKDMEAGTVAAMPVHLLFNGWIGLVHHYLLNGDLFAPGEPVLKRYGAELLQHYLLLVSTV